MLKMVNGTGIIGVDMICPLGVSTPQPPNYDRVELEGTGMLVLPNSLDAPLDRLELGGKTEQVQTSGKNLFDFSKLETGRINISTGTLEEHNHTRRLADYIDITGITSFSVYLPGYNKANGAVYVVIYYYDKDKKYLSYRACGDKQEKYENIAPVENAVYIKVTLEQNTIDNPQNIFKVQLEKGAKSTDYEPYTGGKPSPSPEYPQEIKNVGKWNEETQKYEIDVKVTGRNLFNGKLSKGKFITDDMNVVSDLATMNTFDKPVEIEPNTDYVISANGVIWEGNINVYDENGKKIVQHFTWKFKTPSNAKYIRASISNARAPIDSKIQMEYGTAMNEFEQYHQPQVLTLTSDRPITKWDKLVEQGGEIGWLYKSKIIDGFDGQSSNITLGGKQGKVQHFSVVFADTPNGNGNGDIYVDRYRAIAMSYTKAEFGICCNWNSGVKFFSAPNENVTTVQEFKTWLAENPLVLVYETTSTEFIPLPQPEQNAIRALKTYYPTTVITADGGELDPDIKVTYRKEI